MKLRCLLLVAVFGFDSASFGQGPPSTAIYVLKQGEEQAQQIAVVPKYSKLYSPELSPDKEWVAVDTGDTMLLVKVDDGTVRDLGEGMMPNWSPDSLWVAYCKHGLNRGVYVRSIDGKHEQVIAYDGWGIQWAPDGLQAAYIRGNTIVVYDFITDTRRSLPLPEYRQIYWNFTWSPDSQKICFRGAKGNQQIDIAVVDVTTDTPQISVLCDGKQFNPDIAWHPTRDLIALPAGRGAFDHRFGQIYTVSLSPNSDADEKHNADQEHEIDRLPHQPHNRHNGGMSWSKDGKWLVFVSSP